MCRRESEKGHYVKNIGNTDVQYLELFRSSHFADVSRPAVIGRTAFQHRQGDDAKFPNDRPLVVPQ
jgi:oxalate decarboxylase